MSKLPYRDKEVVRRLAGALAEAASGLPFIKIMHVCGTHEHEIGRYSLRQLLPRNISLVAGPGCPVCITPAYAIATVMKMALLEPKPIICTYGDIVRVPIRNGSIFQTKGFGADVRIVYGPREAVRVANENPQRTVVFFSIGFETTAAPVANMLSGSLPSNFFIYCCHRYVPAAVEVLASMQENDVAGYLLPGHASVITGWRAYDFLPKRYGLPAAVAGFEPVDILAGLVSVVRQIKSGRPTVANCYPRAVSANGNVNAQRAIENVFERTDASWRGIGVLPKTGFMLREEFQKLDALNHFGMEEEEAEDIVPGCSCHLVITGRRMPRECSLFGSVCTPENPQGPCMVGSEGTCRAHYFYPEAGDV